MNRKEALDHAKQKLTYTLSYVECVNKIYDDFESRTCENCEYFTTPKFKYSVCEKIGNVTVPHDFGCNRFEEKG